MGGLFSSIMNMFGGDKGAAMKMRGQGMNGWPTQVQSSPMQGGSGKQMVLSHSQQAPIHTSGHNLQENPMFAQMMQASQQPQQPQRAPIQPQMMPIAQNTQAATKGIDKNSLISYLMGR